MSFLDIFRKKKNRNSIEKDECTNLKMEDKLSALYKELVNVMVSVIPTVWEEIHYLGEIERSGESWSSVFYYKDVHINQYIKSLNIPEINHEGFHRELDTVLMKIHNCFLGNELDVWEQLLMSIKNTGAITIDFKYNAIQDSPYDPLTRELIWAYETFGYEPKENTYLKKVLDKYLSGKEDTHINDKND